MRTIGALLELRKPALRHERLEAWRLAYLIRKRNERRAVIAGLHWMARLMDEAEAQLMDEAEAGDE